MSEMPGAVPPEAPPPGSGEDPYKMLDHALEAEKHLEQLATGLGKSDAEPGAIEAVTQMADAMRQVAKGLSRAPAPEEQRPTMDDAMGGMMADRQAARAPA